MNIKVFMSIASLHESTGGPAQSVPNLCVSLLKAGAEVKMFVKNKEGTDWVAGEPKYDNLEVRPIRELNQLLCESRSNPENKCMIHSHGIWLPINHRSSSIAKKNCNPLVISPRGMLEPWALGNNSWKKNIAWKFYQHRDLKAATVIHATSIQEAENLRFLKVKRPIVIIPNGVAIPHIGDTNKNESNNKIALFLSRIHPKKGLINLVRAWAKVKPSGWKIIIAGPNEDGHQREVETEVSKYALKDVFEFKGPLYGEDKIQIYHDCDLFILPTFSENFGIAVAEALSYGIPVITTKGAPWEELESHDCGWWVDIGVEPLAEAIKEATSLSTQQRHEMGERGRRLVEHNYSWDKIGEEMLSVYEWVLNGSNQPDCVLTE